MMITAGFSVNEWDVTYGYSHSASCLYRAIRHQQYNVVRLLANHTTSCEYCDCCVFPYVVETEPAIVLLALDPNAPLDLFDLLATPDDLSEALFTALASRALPIALHLIKLGANVNMVDEGDSLPIEYFVGRFMEKSPNTFKAEHFRCLLPSRAKSENILRPICVVLSKVNHEHDTVVWQMLQQLIQRLHFWKPLKIHRS